MLPGSFRFETPLDLVVPLTITPEQRAAGTRDQHWLRGVGRLAPGAGVAELNGELEVIGARLRADHPGVYGTETAWRPVARPLLDNLVSDVRPSLWLLAAAAGLVLLIVCGHVATCCSRRPARAARAVGSRAWR